MSVLIKKVARRLGRLSRIGLKSYSDIAIDIGAGATHYTGFQNMGTTTWIDKTNPANRSGLITSVDVWAETNLVGFRVGTFYLVSGTTYKCRGSATIGAVAAGSKQTFAVSIPVVVGDIIGCWGNSGMISFNYTGGGVGQALGEYIDPGDSASFTFNANQKFAVYGQGKTSW